MVFLFQLHREPPPNKTVFNCPAPNPPIPNIPFKSPQKHSNTNNTFSNFIKSNTSVNLGSKKTISCDMCHETFEHQYLLWIHKSLRTRIVLPLRVPSIVLGGSCTSLHRLAIFRLLVAHRGIERNAWTSGILLEMKATSSTSA